jgi:hypothetical protein
MTTTPDIPETYITAAMVAEDGILAFFDFEHLPPHLQAFSRPFAELAVMLQRSVPRSAERTMAFRKLLEAKDAAVRAALPPRERR